MNYILSMILYCFLFDNDDFKLDHIVYLESEVYFAF
jgi:hypothetical protein